jgi:hypothetical protein
MAVSNDFLDYILDQFSEWGAGIERKSNKPICVSLRQAKNG